MTVQGLTHQVKAKQSKETMPDVDLSICRFVDVEESRY